MIQSKLFKILKLDYYILLFVKILFRLFDCLFLFQEIKNTNPKGLMFVNSVEFYCFFNCPILGQSFLCHNPNKFNMKTIVAINKAILSELLSHNSNTSPTEVMATTSVCTKRGIPISCGRMRFSTMPVTMLVAMRNIVIARNEVPVLA